MELIGGKAGNIPVGTKAEVEAAGMDPARTTCCHVHKLGEVQGCPMAGDCHFDRPRLGGFKFVRGPRNIGYRAITGDRLVTGEPVVKEDWCSCYTWVRTLQSRADFGDEQRRKNKPGELISVIAQEGEEIVTKIEFPFNIDGKVIRQDRRMFAILEKQGIPVDMNDRREAAYYDYVKVRMEVPAHARPGQAEHLTYAQEVLGRERDRLEREERIESAIVAEPAREVATIGRAAAGPVAASAEPVRVVRNPYGRAGKPKDAAP